MWCWSFPKSVSFWPILSNVQESAFVSKAKQENLEVFFVSLSQHNLRYSSFHENFIMNCISLLGWYSVPPIHLCLPGSIQEVPVELLQFSLSSCSVELQRLDLQDWLRLNTGCEELVSVKTFCLPKSFGLA